MSDNALILAVPSKGRLQEQTYEFFASKGLTIERPNGARSYMGYVAENENIVVRFLSASEIAKSLIKGELHFGVTGLDLIHETSLDGPQNVQNVQELGFGQADVVLAMPKGWVDVQNMNDLADVAADFYQKNKRFLRIATKYTNITRQFFKQYGIVEYRLVESLGATEAAPAAGTADLIVDITSTGSTLKANALKVLDDGVMLKSQACLFTPKNPQLANSQRILYNSFLGSIKT